MSGHSILPNAPRSPNSPTHTFNDVFAETSSAKFQRDQEPPSLRNGDPEIPNYPSVQEKEFRARDESTLVSQPERSHIHKKLESIKAWSLNTFKCTKQVIEEKLGAATRTCDEVLDLRIETLRQMQRHYRLLLDDARRLSFSLAKTVQLQREFAGHLAHAGQQQPELTGDFASNAELQRNATVNGEKLLCVLEVFCDGLDTLVNRTFEDTMLTIRNMNSARIEYDAYRKEAESIQHAPKKSGQNEATTQRRLEEALSRFHISEDNFLNMKAAVDAKLRLLHENRVRVMQHNLLLLNKATSAYFSGNSDQLDDTLSQFNVKIITPHAVTNRWSKKQPNRVESSGRSSQVTRDQTTLDACNNMSNVSNGSD